MKVLIKSISNNKYEYDLEPNTTIYDIRNRLSKELNLTENQYPKLFLSGRVLFDEQIINDLTINLDAQIIYIISNKKIIKETNLFDLGIEQKKQHSDCIANISPLLYNVLCESLVNNSDLIIKEILKHPEIIYKCKSQLVQNALSDYFADPNCFNKLMTFGAMNQVIGSQNPQVINVSNDIDKLINLNKIESNLLYEDLFYVKRTEKNKNFTKDQAQGLQQIMEMGYDQLDIEDKYINSNFNIQFTINSLLN